MDGSSGAVFGTDGIRGVYGEGLTDGAAMLVGNSLGAAAEGGTIVIGRDTRTSGSNLARSLAEGAAAAGATVADLGIVTTPCVAYAARESGASAGVMISASHNPARYNGIKVFDGEGKKLSRERERLIEEHIARGVMTYAKKRGEVLPSPALAESYLSAVLGRTGRLSGLNVVLDCACGSACAVAPALFRAAGAEVHTLFSSPDGEHINDGCGALHPEVVAEETVRLGADLGLSFDGDADRVIACDEKGNIVDGDKILFVLAPDRLQKGTLPCRAVVGTVLTNLGAEEALAKIGISLVRTDVGDHNVTRCMCENGLLLGSEQSGHVIVGDFLPTGDGIFAGAALAAVMKEKGEPLSRLADIRLFPQISTEVTTEKKTAICADRRLADYISAVTDMLGGTGRVLVRPSGTEPKIRIMTECRDPFLAAFAARSIEMFLRTAFPL